MSTWQPNPPGRTDDEPFFHDPGRGAGGRRRSIALAAETKGKTMSYGEAREFLAKHTELVELTNDDGARVAVCPEWQGRVMTSTCGGMEGLSFGFVNDEFITAGKAQPALQQLRGRRAHVALARGRAVQPLVRARQAAEPRQLVHPAGLQRRRLESRLRRRPSRSAWPRR